jgi:spore coat polysaccharide biosynthesis protein SpsF
VINYGVVIQARMGSTRRPGKINYPLLGEPMLAYQVNRLKTGGVDNIFIATTNLPTDDITESIAKDLGVPCFRGSETDVLGRYLACCQAYGIENAIRVGGDDPLIDPQGIKVLIEAHKKSKNDLVYASHREGWIYGTAAELVSLSALEDAHRSAQTAEDKEHVVSFLKRSDVFTKQAVRPDIAQRRNDIFLSVDYQEDLDLISQVVEFFNAIGDRYGFSQTDLIALYDSGKLKINNKHLHEGF